MFDKNINEKTFEKGKLFRNYIWGENGMEWINRKIPALHNGRPINFVKSEERLKKIERNVNENAIRITYETKKYKDDFNYRHCRVPHMPNGKIVFGNPYLSRI
jgi:hypothetical protein